MIRQPGFWNKDTQHNKEHSYFFRLRSSQCEDWYMITPYISEFWCCISNLPFLYVAYLFNYLPLAIVGIISLVHHTIPYQWLRDLDCLFAWIKIGTLFIPSSPIYQHIELLQYGTIPIMLMIADGATKGKKYRQYIHPVWHLGAAYFMYQYLQYI